MDEIGDLNDITAVKGPEGPEAGNYYLLPLSINERPISKTRRNSVGTLSEGKFLIPIPGVLSITSFTKSIIS